MCILLQKERTSFEELMACLESSVSLVDISEHESVRDLSRRIHSPLRVSCVWAYMFRGHAAFVNIACASGSLALHTTRVPGSEYFCAE
jgi:hypothetical protein